MIEDVKPIRGYATRTFDAVARGRRVIKGQMAINFKADDYLYDKINNYIEKRISQDFDNIDSLKGQDFYQPIGTQSTMEDAMSKADGQEEFLKMAAEQESKYWDAANESKINNPSDVEPYFFSINEDDMNANLDRAERVKIRRKVQKLRQQGLTIEIGYGKSRELSALRSNKAVRKLYGVQLTGLGQQIQLAGQPVRERYTFIAKDLSR